MAIFSPDKSKIMTNWWNIKVDGHQFSRSQFIFDHAALNKTNPYIVRDQAANHIEATNFSDLSKIIDR